VDTIAAIATAQGRGGVGVIRVSGSNLEPIIFGILGRCLKPRHATLSNFVGSNGVILDLGVALYFPSPHSFTGEDVLELQGHGGPIVLQMILQRCIELGAKYAMPGEFTQRAFLNGKIDLAQAESVADLIDATSREAATSAMRSLSGEFSTFVNDLVAKLIHLRMLVEAMLDFPEEEIDHEDMGDRDSLLLEIKSRLQVALASAKQGSLLRDGAHIVIAGQPNVGKSSLLNKLAGEEVALVSTIPGTTRDVVRQDVQIQGVTLHFMDTAGLRDSSDEVEKMGIALTHQTIRRADLILLLLDATQGMTINDELILGILPRDIPRLTVWNKIDIATSAFKEQATNTLSIEVSAKTGFGLEELRERLLNMIGWRMQESGALMARERHIRALTTAQTHLNHAKGVIAQSELFAEELKYAQDALGEITGKLTSDDLLGEIFSSFCIGK
ncbi:MAG: tRNA uridine-5-carboxymethylaminomethyl(34) synthesis GTPase MnmE, partial [Gallionella sp.]